MITSNVSFESNVQVIDASVKIDKEFLSHVYNYEALEKLCNHLGGATTDKYVISGDQYKILDSTHTCAKGTDPCWGIVIKDGHHVPMCKCVDTTCEDIHMCRYSSGYPTEDEIEKFYPYHREGTVTSEYDYYNFIYFYSDMLQSNRSCNIDDYYSDDYEQLHTKLESSNFKINLFEHIESKNNSFVTIETIDEPFIEEYSEIKKTIGETVSGSLFNSFIETSQETIIQSNGDESILVDAGPGTGKTYTLIKRLIYMIDELHADPEGILVLCFTNAAVDVIEERLKDAINNGSNPQLSNIDVRTFHSFAWWLIGQANEHFVDDGWHYFNRNFNLSFDGSLNVATSILEKFGDQVVENWEHFIVDEIQDLTNERAKFVLSLVKACSKVNCGMTLFGDSCQAIYDYEAKDDFNSISSVVFYRTLLKVLPTKTKYYSLKNNYRQTTRLIESTVNFRKSILNQDIKTMKCDSIELIKKYKSEDINNVTSLDMTSIERIKDDGTLCILTRNNGEALLLSTSLLKKSIAHDYALSNTEQHFALWISDIFQSYEKAIIFYEDFANLLSDVNVARNSDYVAKDIWDKMLKLSGQRGNVADVKKLLAGVLNSRTDYPEFYENNKNTLTISNIHRAKGKEFDSVLVDLSFCSNLKEKAEEIDEYKVMYVAVTRPRTRLSFANIQPQNQRLKKYKYINRWGKERDGKVRYLEFNGISDVDLSVFSFLNQECIRNIKTGGSIRMERRIKDGRYCYDIIYEPTEEIIGNLNDDSKYLSDLKSLSMNEVDRSFEYPTSIENLYVSGIFSRIIDVTENNLPADLQNTAHNGVWKWIEITGAGYLQYGEY